MKKLMALVTALLLICTLVGCGGAPLKKPSEQDTLALLRQEIADSGSQCGVAYLGYMPDGGDVPAWLADNGWTQTFPFLSDLTEQQVVTQEGGEVYCIVPAEKNARVTVEAYDAFNETDPLGDVLYDSADGAPICLRGNVSEIMGNLRVTVETAAGQAVYFPSLSLRDGSVSTLTEQGRVYNFTPGGDPRRAPDPGAVQRGFRLYGQRGEHGTLHLPRAAAGGGHGGCGVDQRRH